MNLRLFIDQVPTFINSVLTYQDFDLDGMPSGFAHGENDWLTVSVWLNEWMKERTNEWMKRHLLVFPVQVPMEISLNFSDSGPTMKSSHSTNRSLPRQFRISTRSR